MAIDPQLAIKLISSLSKPEVTVLARATTSLDHVNLSDMEEVLQAFCSSVSAPPGLTPSKERTEALLLNALPSEEAQEIIEDVFGPNKHLIWHRLERLKRQDLAAFLKDEDPAVIAYAFSHFRQNLSAEVLSCFADDLRSQVVLRMLSPRELTEPIRDAISHALEVRFVDFASKSNKSHSSQWVASVLNQMPRPDCDSVLKCIEAKSPADALAIAQHLFNFEDLINLSQSARSIIFEAVPQEKWIFALQGMPPDFTDTILSSLSGRAKRLIESEMASKSDISTADIDRARRIIEDVVLQLGSEGAVELKASSGTIPAESK